VKGSTVGRTGWVPIALAVGVLAWVTIGRVCGKVGHAGAALDDAYIHFQYARAMAEGHPFRFQAGEAPTSGATSLAWPTLLAPFWLVGFRGEAILWPAWALSFGALGALAWEAWALTRKLAGETAAIGAAAMVLTFPAFAWFAASGMEVVPFAWLLARSARRASEWAEATGPEERTKARAKELVALAWGATFMRPEGALACVAVALVLAWAPRETTWRSRAFALAALAPVVAQPLVLLAATGSARSTTALVKLLPGNPYYVGSALREKVIANGRDVLSGAYSQEFFPTAGMSAAFAGLVAVAIQGGRTGRLVRAALVIGLALALFVPCLYFTCLWNRLRYLWPFAAAWLVGLACLARVTGDALALFHSRARVATPIACGVVVGALLMHMDWTLDDVAQSASGIDRQQSTLGRWVKEDLPSTARVGVNDTGAIAYFGDRATFDVVGLTTRSEGRYWVAGVGSRLEHYERLHASDPRALPTHFVVYPEWFGLDELLGAPLKEATVTDASILGGRTMRAYVADYARLGSGEDPWSPLGPAIDVLDVADLESEAQHRYQLLGARDGEEVAGVGVAPDGRTVLDGGRTGRVQERFVAHLHAGVGARAVVRLQSQAPTRVVVRAAGKDVALFEVDPGSWVEAEFPIPAAQASAETPIDLVVVDGGTLSIFHYWFGAP
jgi:hypothetical protein